MRESTFFQEILAEGRAEGRQQGRLERGRADILEALTLRFGPDAGAEFSERLNAIQDTEELLALLRTVIKCRGIGGFRRTLASHRA
jgi:predicted transposase YdaD